MHPRTGTALIGLSSRRRGGNPEAEYRTRALLNAPGRGCYDPNVIGRQIVTRMFRRSRMTCPRIRSGVWALLCALFVAGSAAAADGTPPGAAGAGATAAKPTLWVIPHTHWEGAVFKTREEYLEMGLPNILKAIKLLREQPEYRFVLDQVAYVKPFLERYPDQEADFKRSEEHTSELQSRQY